MTGTFHFFVDHSCTVRVEICDTTAFPKITLSQSIIELYPKSSVNSIYLKVSYEGSQKVRGKLSQSHFFLKRYLVNEVLAVLG